MQKNGKTEARINILIGDASINCDRGAALNEKTQTRIDILTWDGSMNCDRGAALNGKTQARINILRCEAFCSFDAFLEGSGV